MVIGSGRRGLTAALALLGLAIVPAAAGAQQTGADPEASAQTVLTAKERLRGKGYDEQRVNDCKVPEALRGARARPAGCQAKAGAKPDA